MSKPSVPKGTRDFLPGQSLKRKYIFDTIESVFLKYGFRPIETPALENLSTLTGKYGEEGDRLLFKVLNNGDFLKKADKQALANEDSQALVPSIAKRGLRYDLTVPFARFVAMHQNDIAFPFKRYQIQPVWRADRPQKGRYQEFYQCDVDVVGSSSLMYEAELIGIYDEVFARLNLPVEIKINHRKVLSGIAEKAGVEERIVDMTVAVDKLDKIGWDKVKEELSRREFNPEQIEEIHRLFQMSWDELLSELEHTPSGPMAIADMGKLKSFMDRYQLSNKLTLDTTLARGLSYYTGVIFEVKALDTDMGSIGGGGRYDDLTSIFGLRDVSGVGVSFGAERIYDVLEEKSLFPDALQTDVALMFCPMDDESLEECFAWALALRQDGVHCDVYPEPAKMKKQLKHVDQRQLHYAAIMGSQEREQKVVLLKNMRTGDQQELKLEQLQAVLKG